VTPLERELRELSRAIAFPPVPDVAPRVAARIARGPERRRPPRRRIALIALAVLLAAAAIAIAATPGGRHAVERLLGLRGASVERVSTLPRVPPFRGLDLGDPTSLAEARRGADFPVRVPAVLGPPEAVYVDRSQGSPWVSLVYSPRPGLPRTRAGVGLVLTQLRGDLAPEAVGKLVATGTRVRRVEVGADRGYLIEGAPHLVIFRDAAGDYRTETARLAGATLLWTKGPVLLRLEADLPGAALVRLGASVRP
jgi:hypothetical protein